MAKKNKIKNNTTILKIVIIKNQNIPAMPVGPGGPGRPFDQHKMTIICTLF
jgi:hypothetical protein